MTLRHRDARRWVRRGQVAHGDAADPSTGDERIAEARDFFEFRARGTWLDGVVTPVLDAPLDDRREPPLA